MRDLTLLVVCALFCAFTAPEEPIAVYLIGDSTMANKRQDAFPETGWGMPFSYFFDSTVVVENHAKNGRSTRTFISENLWEPIVKNLKPGDYVFIQFGHNDEVKEKTDRYTTPDQFKSNLTRFVADSRAKGAVPILMTPVARRKFTNGQLEESHAVYSALVRDVARDLKVILIDLDLKSQALLREFGEENSKLLFLHLTAGEHPNYPEGKTDNTHFSELGARKVAQIVLSEIVGQRLELAERIVKQRKKV